MISNSINNLKSIDWTDALSNTHACDFQKREGVMEKQYEYLRTSSRILYITINCIMAKMYRYIVYIYSKWIIIYISWYFMEKTNDRWVSNKRTSNKKEC